jgi:hypothetical protein
MNSKENWKIILRYWQVNVNEFNNLTYTQYISKEMKTYIEKNSKIYPLLVE